MDEESHIMPTTLTEDQIEMYLPWQAISPVWNVNKSQIDNEIVKHKIRKRYYKHTQKQKRLCLHVGDLLKATHKRGDKWPDQMRGFIDYGDTYEKLRDEKPVTNQTQKEHTEIQEINADQNQIAILIKLLKEQPRATRLPESNLKWPLIAVGALLLAGIGTSSWLIHNVSVAQHKAAMAQGEATMAQRDAIHKKHVKLIEKQEQRIGLITKTQAQNEERHQATLKALTSEMKQKANEALEETKKLNTTLSDILLQSGEEN